MSLMAPLVDLKQWNEESLSLRMKKFSKQKNKEKRRPNKQNQNSTYKTCGTNTKGIKYV